MTVPLPTLDADHRYRVDGREVPGVTRVLRAAGVITFAAGIPPAVVVRALSRGTAVHLGLALRFEGTLDPGSVAPECEGYLFAFDAFCAEGFGDFRPEVCEPRWYHPQLGYAGAPDVLGVFQDRGRWLLDVKCGSYQRGYEAQVAAYRMLAAANGYPTTGGALLLLRADGTFQVRPCEDRYAESDFRSALHLYQRQFLIREDRDG